MKKNLGKYKFSRNKIVKILLRVIGIIVAVGLLGWLVGRIYFSEGRLLETAVNDNDVRFTGDCAKMTAPGSSHVYGYPVPAKPKTNKTAKTTKIFRVFFYSIYPSYPAQAPGKKVEAQTPFAMAEFGLDGSAFCVPLTTQASLDKNLGERLTPEADRLGISSFTAKRSEFYRVLAKTANLYFAGAANKEAQKVANDFMDKFLFISEPGLKQFYYRLNPNFWNWLEKLTGRKLVDKSPVKVENYNYLKMVYSLTNDSLAPPHNLITTLTIYQADTETIKGEYAFDDEGVLTKKAITVSLDQFKELVNEALALEPRFYSLEEGCTDGATASLKLSQGNKTLLEISGYRCGGQSDNENLDEFAAKIENLATASALKIEQVTQFFDLVTRLESFPTLTPDEIAKTLSVTLVENKNQSDQWYVYSEGKAENTQFAKIIDSLELRTPRETNQGGLLILNLKDGIGITEKDILAKYPKAFPQLLEATAPTTLPFYLVVKMSWGKVSFGITRDETKRVVEIILDSYQE